MESISNWAWLPKDVLHMIMEKLVPLSDCIRFSLVCKPWRSAAIENLGLENLNKRRHDDLHRQQIPLLMIPTNAKSHERRGLYIVTEKKVSRQQLYVPHAKRCCGSSHGWLFIEDETMSMSLLNPFSGALIRLPPFLGFYEKPQQGQGEAFDKICLYHDFEVEYEEESENEEDETDGEEVESESNDDDDDEEEESVNEEDREEEDEDGGSEDDDGKVKEEADGDDSMEDDDDDDDDDDEDLDDYDSEDQAVPVVAHKLILSKDPDLYPDDYVVMAICGRNRRLAFIKSGDENWTYMHHKLEFFEDIIYGHGKFLCVRTRGDVWSWDVAEFPLKVEKIARPVALFVSSFKTYLVESPENGELILVFRFLDTNYMTDRFKVMKRQVKQGRSRWVQTLNIGDAALFLGHNYSSSVLASDFPGCHPNCIYFTDIFYFYSPYINSVAPNYFHQVGTLYDYHRRLGGPCDNGFYKLKNRRFGKHYKLRSQESMTPSIWILPKFR